MHFTGKLLRKPYFHFRLVCPELMTTEAHRERGMRSSRLSCCPQHPRCRCWSCWWFCGSWSGCSWCCSSWCFCWHWHHRSLFQVWRCLDSTLSGPQNCFGLLTTDGSSWNALLMFAKLDTCMLVTCCCLVLAWTLLGAGQLSRKLSVAELLLLLHCCSNRWALVAAYVEGLTLAAA